MMEAFDKTFQELGYFQEFDDPGDIGTLPSSVPRTQKHTHFSPLGGGPRERGGSIDERRPLIPEAFFSTFIFFPFFFIVFSSSSPFPFQIFSFSSIIFPFLSLFVHFFLSLFHNFFFHSSCFSG